MIKVERIGQPVELTEDVQYLLTEEFKNDKKKDVWNKKYIRDRLLEECKNKCVYCECFIGDGHKEMHVDHFHYKDKYADEVVVWDNLNPSCPHCNKRKSLHDTYEEPIVNPFEQNPQSYFYLKHYRYYSRNASVEKVARRTIDVLGLNDTDDAVKHRFLLGEELIQKIQDVYDLTIENKEILCNDTRKRNRVLRGCRNILKKGIAEAEYAAFMATIIMEESYYEQLKGILQKLKLWDRELEDLDREVKKNKMQTAPDVMA